VIFARTEFSPKQQHRRYHYFLTTATSQAILTYAKAYPDLSFEELETVFRESGMNTYLIAKEQAVSDTHTIVNLQGKIDMKFAVSIQFSDKPRRAAFAEGWPKTKEENMARLAEAGFILDRMVQKCSNCAGTYYPIYLVVVDLQIVNDLLMI
jgi:hypothetical protein